jgi:hypothetical protein
MQLSAIQQVIQQANAEQVQALASGDSSVMSDTATADHLQELQQINDDLVSGGVHDIKLTRLEWGPVTVNGNSATATTYETWTMHFQDGTTQASRDTNLYTLVQDNGAWKIQSNDHPDSGTTTPSAPVAPTRPNPSAPSQVIPGFPSPFITIPGPGTTQPSPGTTSPTSPQPRVTPSQDTSHNWSGYATTDGKFTAVSGTWTVPQVNSNGASGVGATWVGIGGVTSHDLIQAGTEETDMGSGRVQYSAWVETLPQASRPVRFSVHPGDSVTVSINEQSTNNWQISFNNNTTGQTYQTSMRYTSSHSSAEWVVEAPSSGNGILPLDNFGTVSFSGASATENGQSANLSQSHAQPITMLSGAGQALAVPSSIGGDGSSFSVSRTNAPATAPSTGRGRTVPSVPSIPVVPIPNFSSAPLS